MSTLELKVPPDVVWLAVAALMWVASALTPGLHVVLPLALPVGLGLLAVAVALVVAARVALARAGTTFSPVAPERTSALVTNGIYRFTRNPIYVSFALTTWTVPVWTPDQLLVAIVLTAYCVLGPILKEARYRRIHGARFEAYARTVPYFVPRLTPAHNATRPANADR